LICVAIESAPIILKHPPLNVQQYDKVLVIHHKIKRQLSCFEKRGIVDRSTVSC